MPGAREHAALQLALAERPVEVEAVRLHGIEAAVAVGQGVPHADDHRCNHPDPGADEHRHHHSGENGEYLQQSRGRREAGRPKELAEARAGLRLREHAGPDLEDQNGPGHPCDD